MAKVELKPGLVDYFVTTTARLRWDEANELPQTRVCVPCGEELRTDRLDLPPLLEICPACLRRYE
jgi:hypothetical protein